jgi:predicted Zn-dependent peptidase
VWLIERHALPIVSVTVVVRGAGASSDPGGKHGLAWATANMLDEGAGKRNATEFATAVEMLGAQLGTQAGYDAGLASLTVLKSRASEGLALLGDAVVSPRFDGGEWSRVQELWKNDLRARTKDPQAVMQVVSRAVLFGKNHPYGHPPTGTIASSAGVTLADLVEFHRRAWRPERATFVVVGDMTRAEVDAELDRHFGGWESAARGGSRGAGSAAARTTTPWPIPTLAPPPSVRPRFVLVDRPDAPQSLVTWLRPGVGADHAELPVLERANIALGGSFTSRLNQDLREEHGWTYGAGSVVNAGVGTGLILARASVVTAHTGEAIGHMLADIRGFSEGGLTPEEVQKTLAQVRADGAELLESVERLSSSFAYAAGQGLAPDALAKAAAAREAATQAALHSAVRTHFRDDGASVIVVGPKDAVLAQTQATGLPAPEFRDEEGNVVTASKK